MAPTEYHVVVRRSAGFSLPAEPGGVDMHGNKAIRLAVVVMLLVALAALSGCNGAKTSTNSGAPAGGTGSATVVIVMKDMAFTPAKATVKIGDTVVFENQDSVEHRVNIGGQDLGQQAKGAKIEWKAAAQGTAGFICTIHPEMTGEVLVQ